MQLNFESILQKVSKVRLPSGMVGKVSIVLIVFCISMTAIAFMTKNEIILISIAAMIFFLCLIGILKLIKFASLHPETALMEGAEFLIHEQIKYASKGSSEFLFNPQNLVQASEVKMIDDEKIINEPDKIEPSNIDNQGGN